VAALVRLTVSAGGRMSAATWVDAVSTLAQARAWGDGREALRTSVRMWVPCMPGDADLLQADAVAKPHDTRTLPCGMSCETCSPPASQHRAQDSLRTGCVPGHLV